MKMFIVYWLSIVAGGCLMFMYIWNIQTKAPCIIIIHYWHLKEDEFPHLSFHSVSRSYPTALFSSSTLISDLKHKLISHFLSNHWQFTVSFPNLEIFYNNSNIWHIFNDKCLPIYCWMEIFSIYWQNGYLAGVE